MKENEASEKKSAVKFDETQNIIKEFAKNEKLHRPPPSKPKHEAVKFDADDDDIEPVRKIQKVVPEEAKVTPPPKEEEEIPWEDQLD